MDELIRTSNRVRPRLLLAVAVLTIAAAVWGVSQAQRSAADRAFAESRAGHRMLAAMLNQETGLRGFALSRRDAFDRFRRLNGEYQEQADARRRSDLGKAGLISVSAIIGISLLFGGFGYFAIERQAAGERRRRARARAYRTSQAEFNETMQIMRDEDEAYALVKQHLERSIPDAGVVVLSRNNSANRLTAATPLLGRSALAEALAHAEPDSCLSVRLAREYRRGEGADPLLSCDICGMAAGEVTCVPSLVSGEVIGSVLVEHPSGLRPQERDRVVDSVAHAAPVLANLRNLAIAEIRAATDALSGLPNQRSCQDNLKRMVAHASRAVSPISAVLLDLDHFKQINDRFGHGAGDDVLASVGEVLTGCLRTSDFAGRYGGEESSCSYRTPTARVRSMPRRRCVRR